MIKFIKNNSVKIISIMFIMLTIFMVSTSVFATELSEQYSQYYVTGGSISSLGVSACEYDGPWPLINLKYGYFKVGEKLYCLMADGSGDKLVNFKQHTNMWLEGVSGVSCYFKEYNFSTNTWGAIYSVDGIECKPLPITVYSETEYNIYLSDGTLVYDYEEIYQETIAKKIVYEITYDENNKTAQVSASIKNCVVGDRLYYSLLGYSITGKLMNPIELNQSQATAITLNKNTMIHLQALDSER